MPDQLTDRKGISVEIKLDGNGFATGPEFDLRSHLSDEIEARGIGEYQGGGSGGGWMDISFEAGTEDRVPLALSKLETLLEELGIKLEHTKIEVFDIYEQICDEMPPFQPGDCLGFQYEDGDYGAALVLSNISPFSQAEAILVGVLDYKSPTLPDISIFESRPWLIGTHVSRQGQPYCVWLHCYGGIEVQIISHITLLESDPKKCNFSLSWELLAEYTLREKNRFFNE